MKPKATQPDLIPPEHTTTKITVAGADLAATEERLKDMGAVLMGFSVKGSNYTLSVILPPGEMIEAMERQPRAPFAAPETPAKATTQ
jgi:hypothetical protein